MGDEQLITKSARPFDDDVKAAEFFATTMVLKLQKNRYKAHWSKSSCEYLLSRLKDEVVELEEAMATGDASRIASECADVGNFSMMISDNAINGVGL